MRTTKQTNRLFALLVGLGALAATDLLHAADDDASPQQRRGFRGGESSRVYKAQITPHWFANDTRFWYRNDLKGGAKEFVLVEAGKGTRARAFDHTKLAKALSSASGKEFSADKLPFESVEFIEEGKTVRFEAAEKTWKCDLNSYQCTETTAAPTEKPAAAFRENEDVDSIQIGGRATLSSARRETDLNTEALVSMERRRDEDIAPYLESFAERELDGYSLADDPPQQQAQRRGQGVRRGGFDGEQLRSQRSPDGKWTASIKDHNVFIRSETDEFQLSHDGETNNAYGRLEWSPDSKALVAWRIEPGDRKEVHLLQSSPPGGGRAVLQSRPYPLPGDKFTAYELSVFDVAARKQAKPSVDRLDFGSPRLRWAKDGHAFTYQKVDRGHQRFRIIEVDGLAGKARSIIDEKTDTFIWTAHTETVNLTAVNWLEKSDEIIYVSESNGWRHAYLINAKEGALKNPITKGEWIIRGIDKIDEEARQLWFRASGVYAKQDPYLIHYGRVNFDGSELTWLTANDGNHTIAYSPDRKHIIDTFSRVDLPPMHELRRVSDGKLVCELERADVSDADWEAPEVFVAKGRDGKTDIWGIISRPKNLDPSKKYPVIEDIYAGPQGSFVPKTFSATRRYASQTDLGFILVKIDGMGTANRSKAFHDACWHDLKDAGFEDRILWMKAAAAKYPYVDLTRVGVYGTSAGGQNAAGAALFHPEFYKVAVAACGCHDNRMDKASWNEQWMGYMPPEKLYSKDADNWYSASSNIDNAHRLRGKLMLILGEMDNNVPVESTYRLVDALIKANKDFDFVLVPGAGHGTGGAYGIRRRDDFFVKHLLSKDPPDRNARTSESN